MAFLYVRARCLIAKNGGFRPGQEAGADKFQQLQQKAQLYREKVRPVAFMHLCWTAAHPLYSME
jgi:hypothetical protein